MIQLRDIDHNNWLQCIELEVTEAQKQYVNPNIFSLAEAYAHSGEKKDADEYYRCIPRAIYDNEEMVGFAMLTYEKETDYDNKPAYEIYRLLIAKEYQGKGYGKEVVRLLIEYIKTFPYGQAESIYVEWHPDNIASKRLFEGYGFKVVDVDEDGAVVGKIKLNTDQMEVREFQENDLDIVYAIQRAAYKPLYEKYQDHSTSPYMESKETILQKYTRLGTKGYIFIKDEVPVGAVRINLYPESKSGRVSALGVLPEYQGQGIAQEALLKIEEMHADVERWFLDTILQEPGNCHLYEKIGYKRTGRTEAINEKLTLVFYEK